MTPLRWLGVLLGVQLLLALWTWWPEDRSAEQLRPLLDLSGDAISEIAIAQKPQEGEEPAWLELARRDEGWVIASAQGFPASGAAVEQLIARLRGIEVRAPIATRATSHNSLGVGDKEWARRVRIGTRGGETRELVVGAAQSNSINVRLADANEVYVAKGVSAWSLRDQPDAYWDADYVKADVAEIVEVLAENEEGSFHAVRGEGGWVLDGLAEDEETDGEAFEAWLRKVTRLRMERPVSEQVTTFHGIDRDVRIGWTIQSESESVAGGYSVGNEDGDIRYVKSDTHPFVVAVRKADVEALQSAKRSDFVRERGAGGAEEAEEETGAEGAPQAGGAAAPAEAGPGG